MNTETGFYLAILDSHPVVYKTPLYRILSKRVNLSVLYCDDFGASRYRDADFGVLKWDVDLLNGYNYRILKNFSPRPSPYSFWGVLNPGIIAELTRKRWDAILINGYTRASDWLGLLTAWMNRIPVIFRGEADLRKPTPATRRMAKRILLPFLFRRCDAILYSCESNAAFFKHYSVPDEKLFFAPCAVDNDYFREIARRLVPQKARLRGQMGIPEEAVVALYVGRLTQRKRVLDILKAFGKVNLDNTWLILVGEGPERQVLIEYIYRYNVGRVILPGFKNQSEIGRFYAMADLLIVASEYDPSPKVINEAMNFGLPIIASDRVGTAGDLVRNGENGFVYQVGDIDALAEYMRRLCADSDLRRRMGARSLEIVSEWNLDKQAEAVLAALEYIKRKRGR